jgi:hypothetical protein
MACGVCRHCEDLPNTCCRSRRVEQSFCNLCGPLELAISIDHTFLALALACETRLVLRIRTTSSSYYRSFTEYLMHPTVHPDCQTHTPVSVTRTALRITGRSYVQGRCEAGRRSAAQFEVSMRHSLQVALSIIDEDWLVTACIDKFLLLSYASYCSRVVANVAFSMNDLHW